MAGAGRVEAAKQPIATGCNAVRRSATQRNAAHRSATQRKTGQRSAKQRKATICSAKQRKVAQSSAQSSAKQRKAAQSSVQSSANLTAAQRNAAQRCEIPYNTTQHNTTQHQHNTVKPYMQRMPWVQHSRAQHSRVTVVVEEEQGTAQRAVAVLGKTGAISSVATA